MFRAFLTSDESTAWDSPSVDSASSLGGVEGGVRNSSGGGGGGGKEKNYQKKTLQYKVNYKTTATCNRPTEAYFLLFIQDTSTYQFH